MTNGMQRQTLRDWVHRYNAAGVAGLVSQVRGGRPPSLTAQQLSEIKALVVQGPDPATDGIVRWRCVVDAGVNRSSGAIRLNCTNGLSASCCAGSA